jgi:flagella basal body P-ring formation protein FlgA
MRWLAALILTLLPAAASAQMLVASRTLRAASVITEADVTRVARALEPGATDDLAAVLGLEPRVTIYAGRPLRPGDLGPPALVERNQTVLLIYSTGGLEIRTEGRALARGGAGDMLRVMNLSTRQTVTGVVTQTGLVRVGPPAMGETR